MLATTLYAGGAARVRVADAAKVRIRAVFMG
jgi:hypothetical protein